MKDFPFFSIVIPIYKVENYLQRCIDSILEQEFADFEVILIDDGSPDRCPQICDAYAAMNSRVRVIHKPNGGLSSARNAGIRSANGEYVLFVDSDDFWNSEKALTWIAHKLESAEFQIDVLAFNNVDYSCKTKISTICDRHYNVGLMEHSPKEVVLQYLLRNGLFPGAAWVTVTRREFLLEKKLFFIEGIKAEDVDWLIKVYLEANHFSALNESFYVYQKYRGDSITGTADAKSIDDLLYTIRIWESKFRNGEFSYIADDMRGLLARHYTTALLIFASIPKENKKEYHAKLKEYKYLLKYGRGVIFTALCVLPISFTSWQLAQIRKMRQSMK